MLTRVLLDVGHGGKDPGAVFLAGDELIAEHDVCSEVAAAAELLLRKIGVGVSRMPDGLSISSRAAHILLHADETTLVVSLHMNKAAPEATGAECFYRQGQDEGNIRANELLTAYCAHTGLKRRGAKPDNATAVGGLGIMRGVKKEMQDNVLLLEMGFVSNEADVAAVRLKGAEGVVRGILAVMGREFPAELAAPEVFPDLPVDHWAREAALRLHDLGVLKGYTDGTFRPDQPVTRAEVAVLLDRALRLHGV